MAYAGDREGALAILHEKRAWLPRSGQPNTMGSWWMLALVIEGLVVLGEHSKARELYPLARELVYTGAVVLWPIYRVTQTVAGIAAAAAHQWEAAEDHFQTALKQTDVHSPPSRTGGDSSLPCGDADGSRQPGRSRKSARITKSGVCDLRADWNASPYRNDADAP